jgi:effector-binding domain-containing protein
MFDSAPVEETNLEDLQPDQDLIDRQVPLNVGSDYSAETSNEQIILEENEGDIQNEINQEGNEEINQENGIPAEETSGQDEINNINQVNIENPYDLTPEELKEVNEVYEKNIDKLIPNIEQAWNNIKTSTENYSATKLVAWNPEEVNEAYKPLIQNMQNLQEETGLNPIEATLINPVFENPENYMKRCLQYLTKMNILDKFKL